MPAVCSGHVAFICAHRCGSWAASHAVCLKLCLGGYEGQMCLAVAVPITSIGTELFNETKGTLSTYGE